MSFSIQPLPPVMTTEEVAAVFRCPVASVARYVFAHELAAIQIGRERRFRAEDVLEFIARRPLTIRAKKLPTHNGRGRSGHTGRR